MLIRSYRFPDLIPITQSDTSGNGFKNEDLIWNFQKSDDHANMVEVGPSDYSLQLTSYAFIFSEQDYVAGQGLLHEILFALNSPIP